MHQHASIVCLRLDADPIRVPMLAGLLSSDDRARSASGLLTIGAALSSPAAARALLAAQLGVRPQAIALHYGACGKPFLADHFADPSLQFTLSRCGDVAIIALAYGRVICVDFEKLREIDDVDDIAAGNFSPRERREYIEVRSEHRMTASFKGWTRNVALVEGLGDGLGFPFHCFEVSLAPVMPALLHRLLDRTGANCGWRRHGVSPVLGHVAALALVVSKQDHQTRLREPAPTCAPGRDGTWQT